MSDVVVHCHQKGWMNEQEILFWLSKIWDKRPGALLVWDQCRAHLTQGRR